MGMILGAGVIVLLIVIIASCPIPFTGKRKYHHYGHKHYQSHSKRKRRRWGHTREESLAAAVILGELRESGTHVGNSQGGSHNP